MKGTSILMGIVAVGAFLAAFLFTAQVRGEGQAPSWEQSGVQAEAGSSAQTEPPNDEHAEGGLCNHPSTATPAGIASTVDGDPVLKLLPHDAIASVDEPKMVPAAAAGGFMRDDEMVLGVSDGQEARAYSIWHLDRHEIVNDRLGDAPIAATW